MPEKLRILLLVTRGTIGGAQMFVIALARALRARGEDVTVAFGMPRPSGAGEYDFLKEECKKNDIPYHRLPSLRRSFNPILNGMFIWEAKQLIDQNHYAVVHVNSSNALFAGIAARISRTKPKVIFTFHGLSFFDKGADVPAPVRLTVALAYRALLLFVDDVVFVSKKNYAAARARGLVRTGTGTVIHNGIAPETLAFVERGVARRELERITQSELKDAFIIGSIGRLDMAKNYELLIAQMAAIVLKYPNAKALIIGGGPKRHTLERLIQARNLGGHVILAGEILHAARYLKAFDVFVLPSRYEGFSISILEALFAGIPILASGVGGAKEQLSHAPFQVYQSGDAGVFQARIAHLIDNPAVLKELAEANRARSGDFHIDKTADAYRRLYYGEVGTK